MDGLVSLLPQPYYQRVEAIWDDLESAFGLTGIRVTPYPHFSWQIAEGYDIVALEEAIRQLTPTIPPLPVRTNGIGIFSGPQPVLYIPVVKSQELIELHARIWDLAVPAARGQAPSPYYHPEHWMPHISLAYTDIDPGNINGVITRLAFQSFDWGMEIDNLAFISEPSGTIGRLIFKYAFSSMEPSS